MSQQLLAAVGPDAVAFGPLEWLKRWQLPLWAASDQQRTCALRVLQQVGVPPCSPPPKGWAPDA